MAERHPSRTLLLVPHPGRSGRARRAAVAALLSDRRPRRLRRGDRAGAAGQPRVCAGVDRAAASDLRPAGLLPLAGPARLGVDRVRAADRDRRPADRRLDGVAGPARRVRAARGALLAGCRLGHRVGAHGAVAVAACFALAGRSQMCSAIRVQGTRAQGHLLAGWLRSRLGHGVEVEIEERDRLEGIDLDGQPAPFPPGQPPNASDVLLGAARPLRTRPDLRAGRPRRGGAKPSTLV